MFSPTYNGVRFFSALYVISDIFSVQDIYFQGIIYLHAFFPVEISLQVIFSEINHNPLKSQMVGP